MTLESFIAEIDGFLERSGMAPSAFGKAAAGDPNLIRDLREGRSPSLRLIGRVSDYIKAQDNEKKLAGRPEVARAYP